MPRKFSYSRLFLNSKSTEKINGAIATIVALYRAVGCGNVNVESVRSSQETPFAQMCCNMRHSILWFMYGG